MQICRLGGVCPRGQISAGLLSEGEMSVHLPATVGRTPRSAETVVAATTRVAGVILPATCVRRTRLISRKDHHGRSPCWETCTAAPRASPVLDHLAAREYRQDATIARATFTDTEPRYRGSDKTAIRPRHNLTCALAGR